MFFPSSEYFYWGFAAHRVWFIVIVEFTGLIIIDTVAAGSPYPYIVVRSFEDFADGIVRQIGVVLVILLEGVAVVFIES
mgnify:FL=1